MKTALLQILPEKDTRLEILDCRSLDEPKSKAKLLPRGTHPSNFDQVAHDTKHIPLLQQAWGAFSEVMEDNDTRPITFVCLDNSGLHACQSITNMLLNICMADAEKQVISVHDLTPMTHTAKHCDKHKCDACSMMADYWESKQRAMEAIRTNFFAGDI